MQAMRMFMGEVGKRTFVPFKPGQDKKNLEIGPKD